MFEDMEDEKQNLIDALDEFSTASPDFWDKGFYELVEAVEALKEWDEENGEAYKSLKSFVEEAKQYASDWSDGATLIHESHFEDYCKEMLEDCGDLPKNLPDYIVIDWSATADRLKVDYSEIEWDGETYLIR